VLLGFSFGCNEFRILRLLSFASQFQSRRPPIERTVAVAAGIELSIAMEAAINEICGQIFRVRPFSGGVGKNEGDIELAQQFEKIRDQKTDVPNFYAMTQRPIALYFQPGARL
jgi:hypothetical protein